MGSAGTKRLSNVNLKGTSASNANAKRKRENTQQGAKVKKTRMKNDNLTDPLSQEPVLGRSSNKQTQETISIDKGMMTTSSLSSGSVETDSEKPGVRSGLTGKNYVFSTVRR